MLVSIAAMAFCLLAYGKFYRVAQLGWYDTLALNTAHFEARTADGRSVRVPNALFGFYSYPVAHMSFGFPEGGNYFPTSTNGGTDRFDVVELARSCSFAADQLGAPHAARWDGEGLADFVAALHADVLRREPGPLPWRANLYWHHFWNPPSVFAAFRDVRMDEVTGYELVVDSVCLSNGPGRADRADAVQHALRTAPSTLRSRPARARTVRGDASAL